MLIFIETSQASAKPLRLRYRCGKRSVIDGPFTESKEIIDGFCMVQMRSLDDVLEWCSRFAKIIGDDLEIDNPPDRRSTAAGWRSGPSSRVHGPLLDHAVPGQDRFDSYHA